MGGHEGFSNQRLSSATWFSHFRASALRSKSLPPPSSQTAVRSTSGDSLVRRLGLFDLILLGVGASIGAGVFVVTGTVARDAGPGQLNELLFLTTSLIRSESLSDYCCRCVPRSHNQLLASWSIVCVERSLLC